LENILKIIISGASGLLGREIFKILSVKFNTAGWAFSRSDYFNKVDLLNPPQFKKAFLEFSPDIFIHSAAERRPDIMKKNTETSWKLNVDSVSDITGMCNKNNTRLFFISTDYVFDGTKPPYSEDAETAPLNLYGKSKAEAEKIILKNSKDFCILRIPILYGPSEDPDESAVTALIQLLKKKEDIFVNDGAVRYPTLTTDIAKVILFLIEKKANGIFHYTAEEPYTKYGMAKLIAQYLNIRRDNIFPFYQSDSEAKRPLNSHLNNTKIRRLGFNFFTPFKIGLEEVLKNLLKG
jgi:S-adenosylmethionine synthetase